MKSLTRKIFSWLAAIISVALISFIFYKYQYDEQRHPSTDNAYVHAHRVLMAAQVSGAVHRVLVKNFEHVRAGQLLFTIDSKPFQWAVHRAQAQLELAQEALAQNQHEVQATQEQIVLRQAELWAAQKAFHRVMPLVQHGQLPPARGDEQHVKLRIAQTRLKIAQQRLQQALHRQGHSGKRNARVRVAQAVLNQAKLDLCHTKIRAPQAGVLSHFILRKGAMIARGQMLFALIEDDNWWVRANFKETQLEYVRVGQPAVVHVDMYPNLSYSGVVAAMSRSSGASFSLLPAENATGNWVKVVQRFPVKIRLLHSHHQSLLRLGASCSVKIDTTNHFLSNSP